MTDPRALISKNLSTLSAIGIVTLMPLVSSSIVITLLIKYREIVESMATTQWLFIYIATSLTMAFAITPTTFIAICSGYFLGWIAAPAVVVSYLTASAIGYLIGTRLDGGRLIDSLKDYPKARALSINIHQSDWLLTALLRLSPVLPFSLTNLLLPALNIRLPVFLCAGCIGMLPRTLFSLWLGIKAQDIAQLIINPSPDWQTLILTTLLTIISVGGILYQQFPQI